MGPLSAQRGFALQGRLGEEEEEAVVVVGAEGGIGGEDSECEVGAVEPGEGALVVVVVVVMMMVVHVCGVVVV